MKQYVPNPLIVDRAVAIWRKLVENPKHDNMGDTGTPQERFTMAMGSSLAKLIPNTASQPGVLDKFCEALRAALLKEEKVSYGSGSRYEQSMHVDYGPDQTLANAAEAAGLKLEWPWKTNMWLAEDSLSLRYGYAAPQVFHYPIDDGRWVVTRLSGEDIKLVLPHAAIIGLTIDDADEVTIDPIAPVAAAE